jgi:shikimate kinase
LSNSIELSFRAMARPNTSKETECVRRRLGNRVIVLVGLMGAGKSTVGRRLAEKLGLSFMDADQEIEAAAGKTIPEIFADHGESYFRDGERKVIARLLDSGPAVLATGGGAYVNPETRELIRLKGVSVWLKADLPVLMRRVSRRSNRPLLQTSDPETVMRRLIEERYPIYANADITISTRDVAHTAVVKDVLRGLAQWQGWNRANDDES